MDKEMLALE